MDLAAKLAWLAAAGAVGTLARFGLGALATRVAPANFPWGTLVVNGLGCFAFGYFYAAVSGRLALSEDARRIVLVGFLGAFTTYSTFAFETAEAARQGSMGLAALNVAAQVLLGVGLVFAGFAAAGRPA